MTRRQRRRRMARRVWEQHRRRLAAGGWRLLGTGDGEKGVSFRAQRGIAVVPAEGFAFLSRFKGRFKGSEPLITRDQGL